MYAPNVPATIKLDRREVFQHFGGETDFPDDIVAPEVCHLELTNRCNRNCHYCYLAPRKDEKELFTKDYLRIVSEMAASEVLQISLGGGEPMLRDDLFTIAQHARQCGLNVAMTTNGDYVLQHSPECFEVFSQVNVSVHDRVDNPQNMVELAEKVDHLSVATRVGLNLIFNASTLRNLHAITDFALLHNLEVTCLEYKPLGQCVEPIPRRKEVLVACRDMKRLGVRIRMECSLSDKCTAGIRFISIRNSGIVTPCTFLDMSFGNVKDQSLTEIWSSMRMLRRADVVDFLAGHRYKGKMPCKLK